MATQPYTAVVLRIVAEWLVEKLIKSIDSVGQFDTIAHFDPIPEILDHITGAKSTGRTPPGPNVSSFPLIFVIMHSISIKFPSTLPPGSVLPS